MAKRLTVYGIMKRLATGETAANIDIETFSMQLELVRKYNFATCNRLIEYLTYNRIRNSCALCVKAHDKCINCSLPMIDNSLCCEDEGSIFDRYWTSETQEELETNIIEMIEKLKQCNEIEKSNMN